MGQVAALKEEDMAKAESSGNEEDKNDLKQLAAADSEDEDNLGGSQKEADTSSDEEDKDGGIEVGPDAQVSLLDQHNVLKKKAQGSLPKYLMYTFS